MQRRGTACAQTPASAGIPAISSGNERGECGVNTRARALRCSDLRCVVDTMASCVTRRAALFNCGMSQGFPISPFLECARKYRARFTVAFVISSPISSRALFTYSGQYSLSTRSPSCPGCRIAKIYIGARRDGGEGNLHSRRIERERKYHSVDVARG